MPAIIRYRNTDLDLAGGDGLLPLVAALEAGGLLLLHVDPAGGGSATFTTGGDHAEPEGTIGEMLRVIEALAPADRAAWDACPVKEFNLGYDFGDEPWAFNQGLSAPLLRRMTAAGASLRVTLYPPR